MSEEKLCVAVEAFNYHVSSCYVTQVGGQRFNLFLGELIQSALNHQITACVQRCALTASAGVKEMRCQCFPLTFPPVVGTL